MQRLSNLLSSSALRLSLSTTGVHSTCPTFPQSLLSTSRSPCRVLARPVSSTPGMFPTFVGKQDDRAKAKDGREILEKSVTVQKLSMEEQWEKQSSDAIRSALATPPAHAYTGRTVLVHKDVGTAYKALDQILSRNKVRQTLRMTERHEKKGVKRRRLSSQRWRKRFADEVRKKVQLVMKIRDRGA